MLLDDLELLVGERPRLLQDLGRNPDLADVVEQRAELEPLQRLTVERELAADEQRHVGDPAGVRRRVLVVRLERVRERRDGRHERALEALVVLGALDRELRLVGEAGEQAKLRGRRGRGRRGRDGERADAVRLRAAAARRRSGRSACPSGRRRCWATTSGSSTNGSVRPSSHSWASLPGNRGRPPDRRPARSRTTHGRRGRAAPRPPGSRARRARCRARAPSPRRSAPSTSSGVSALASSRLASSSAFAISAASSCLPVEARLLQRDRGLVGERREQPLPVLVERGRRRARGGLDPVALGELGRRARRERLRPTLATQVSPSQSDARSVSNSVTAVWTVCSQISSNDVRPRDLVREGEQRLRALGLAPLLLVETRVLERDRRLAREHLEQAHVVLVELVEAELRDHDRAGHPRAVAQRHDRERLLELLRARESGSANSHSSAFGTSSDSPVSATRPVMPTPTRCV